MASGIVTLGTLNRPLDDVRNELCELDLLTKRLDEADVILTPFDPGLVYGYFMEGSDPLGRLLGWEEGNIYIPSIKLSTIFSLFGYSDYFSLRHLLRHEYGHALAHKHPSLVKRSKDFTSIFGGRYDHDDCVADYNPMLHISEYAATMPKEDFAETFALYVRNKGNIFKYLYPPAILLKLSFIHNLSEKFAKVAVSS